MAAESAMWLLEAPMWPPVAQFGHRWAQFGRQKIQISLLSTQDGLWRAQVSLFRTQGGLKWAKTSPWRPLACLCKPVNSLRRGQRLLSLQSPFVATWVYPDLLTEFSLGHVGTVKPRYSAFQGTGQNYALY